jgi:AAA15 family ATPase/GTPase
MKIAALVGEPATGKSTLAIKFINSLKTQGCYFKSGLLVGTMFMKDRLVIFGDYSKQHVFSGTDRLSMAVQPHAVEFLEGFDQLYPGFSVFFEGDRLGNISFLKKCKELGELKVFVLKASEEEKAKRHKIRQDNQSEKFLKGRVTKITNIIEAFPDAELLKNEDFQQQSGALEKLTSFLRDA